MDLDFTEEQDMLHDLARGICSAYSSAEAVRAIEDDPVGFPAELWKQLADARPHRPHAARPSTAARG